MSSVFISSYIALWAFVLFQGLVIVALVRSLGEVTIAAEGGRFPQRLPVGSRAPRLRGTDLRAGTEFDSAKAAGHELVILFLSTGCRICQRVADGTRSLPPEPLQVRIAVCHGGSAEAAPFVKALAEDVPVLMDPSGALHASFGVRATPVAFVVDADGRVRGSGSPHDAAELAELIASARHAAPGDGDPISLTPEEARS